MASLSYVTGIDAASEYVRVGHNSSAYNNDAVWSFTPTENISKVTITLKWDNEAANTGWSGAYTYVFALSTSNASGRTAASGSHLKKVTKSLSGADGSVTLSFEGLSLTKGTTYYLRANQNGTTYSSMKAFKKSGNTVTTTAASLNLVFNGEAVKKVVFNGKTVSSLIFNGTKIF